VLQECIEPSGLTITDAAVALWGDAQHAFRTPERETRHFPEMAVRISKVFGGTEEGWLAQQAQYDLAQVRRDRLKLKRLAIA